MLVALSAAASGGCGVGFEPPTALIKPPYGAARSGDLYVGAVVLVKSADNRAVALVATIVNSVNSADVLTEVTVDPGAEEYPPTPAISGREFRATVDLRIPACSIVRIGGPGHRVDFQDPGKRLRLGAFATVTLWFGREGVAEIEALVEPPEDFLAPYAPRPTATKATEGTRGTWSSPPCPNPSS